MLLSASEVCFAPSLYPVCCHVTIMYLKRTVMLHHLGFRVNKASLKKKKKIILLVIECVCLPKRFSQKSHTTANNAEDPPPKLYHLLSCLPPAHGCGRHWDALLLSSTKRLTKFYLLSRSYLRSVFPLFKTHFVSCSVGRTHRSVWKRPARSSNANLSSEKTRSRQTTCCQCLSCCNWQNKRF